MFNFLIILSDVNEYDNTVKVSRNFDMDICAWVWWGAGGLGRRVVVMHFSASTHFELRRTTYFCFKGLLLLLIATDLGEVVKDKIFSLVNNEVSRVNFILKKIPNLENVNNESKRGPVLGAI